jgi:hypothetical protein
MLEFALKQERAKYNKLKYGSGVAAADGSNCSGGADNKSGGGMDDDGMELPPLDAGADNYIAVSNFNWKQGRQLLRQ